MTDTQEKVNDLIGSLVTANEDANEGFSTAAKGVDCSDIKQYLVSEAGTRAAFAQELRPYWHGEDAQKRDSGDHGSFAGEVHQGWMKLKSGLNVSDEEMCKECAFGEGKAIDQYEDALSNDEPLLPDAARALAQNHLKHIRESKSKLEAWAEKS